MSKILNKLLLLLSCTVVILFVSSCHKEEVKSAYDLFSEKYYKKHANGYDKEYGWYQFKEETIKINSKDKEVVTYSLSFDGYIDFDNNSLKGKTTKFIMNTEYKIMKSNEVVEHISTSSFLNEGKYYKMSKNLLTTDINKIGSSNIDYFNVSVLDLLDSYVFYVDAYLELEGLAYDSFSVVDDKVTFDKSYIKDSDICNETSGFYYNENYDVDTLFLYSSKVANDNGISKTENTVKTLLESKEVEINVPTDYDKEFVYDESFMLVL